MSTDSLSVELSDAAQAYRQDYTSLFSSGSSAFENAQASVIKIYSGDLENAPASTLAALAAYCRTHQLGLDVEIAGIETNVISIEGTTVPGSTAAWVARAAQYGIPITRVTVNEALTANTTLGWSLSDVARSVAATVQTIQQLYPSVAVGMDEPVPSISPASLGTWLQALSYAGVHIDRFDADMAWNGLPESTWLPSLEKVSALLESRGVGLGILLNGKASDISGTQWVDNALARAAAVASDPQVKVSAIVAQTWNAYPQITAGTAQSGTLAELAYDAASLWPLYRAGAISPSDAGSASVSAPGIQLLTAGTQGGSLGLQFRATASDMAAATRFGIVLTSGSSTLSAQTSGAGTVSVAAHGLTLTGTASELQGELDSLQITSAEVGSDMIQISVFGADGLLSRASSAVLFSPTAMSGLQTVFVEGTDTTAWNEATITLPFGSSPGVLTLQGELTVYTAQPQLGLQTVMPYLSASSTLVAAVAASAITYTTDNTGALAREADTLTNNNTRIVEYAPAGTFPWVIRESLVSSTGVLLWQRTTWASTNSLSETEQVFAADGAAILTQIDSPREATGKFVTLNAGASGLAANVSKEIKTYDPVSDYVAHDQTWLTDGTFQDFRYSPDGAAGYLWTRYFYDAAGRLTQRDILYPSSNSYDHSNIYYDPISGQIEQRWDVLRAGGYRLTNYDTNGTQAWSRTVDSVDASGKDFKQTIWRAGNMLETDQIYIPRAAAPSSSVNAAPGDISGSLVLAGAGQAQVSIVLLDDLDNVVQTTLTDTAGRFDFQRVAGGSYRVRITASSGTALQAGPADVASGLTSAIVLNPGQTVTLKPETLTSIAAAASITGSALFAGHERSGLIVRLMDAGGAIVGTAVTDSHGAFTFNEIASGPYFVSYLLEPGEAAPSPGETTFSIAAASGQAVTLPALLLGTAPTLSGVIAGEQSAGRTVSLLSSTSDVIGTTLADADGRFRFLSLQPGTYRVRYEARPGTLLASGPADPSTGLTEPVSLTLGQDYTLPVEKVAVPASVSGRVVASTGSSASALLVQLLDSGGALVASQVPLVDGTFSFGNLQGGSYRLRYVTSAAAVLTTGSADAGSGETVPFILAAGQALVAADEAVAAAPGAITGHVISSSGSAWSLRTVTIDGPTPTVVMTDSTGAFQASGLAAGTYQIQLQLRPGENVQENSLTVVVAAGVTTTADERTVGSNPVAVTMRRQLVLGDGNYTISGSAIGGRLSIGDGDETVHISGQANTVTMGDGFHDIFVIGWANHITVGTGNSTIDTGPGYSTIRAAGGSVSVMVRGNANTIDPGSGTNIVSFANAGVHNTVVFSGRGSGVTTLTDFRLNRYDSFDITKQIAGLDIRPDLSNLSKYLSVNVAGDSTYLGIDTTGESGAGQTFAVLSGVTSDFRTLMAKHLLVAHE